MIPNPQQNELIAQIKEDAPRTPGVYCLLGRGEEIIYIGKSIDLQRRLLDHVRPARGPREQRRARMSYEIVSFVTIPTDSELLALLAEDELIKRHLPRHNRRSPGQRDYEKYTWLVLSDDDYPFLELRPSTRGVPAGEVFGPFRDHYRASALKRLISERFGLRLCVTHEPTDMCSAWELRGCPGPCRGMREPEHYAESVAHVRDFLLGDATRIATVLEESMRRHAARNEFEQAQEAKDQLILCERFCARQRFVRDFSTRTLAISSRGEHPQRYLFERGHLQQPEMPVPGDSVFQSGELNEDRRFVADRAHLVCDWILRQGSPCEITFTV